MAELVRRGVSERRSCRLVGVNRSSDRYPPPPEPAAALRATIRALARAHPRYGYRRIAALLRRQGEPVNPKRVWRIWREEGLALPRKRPRKRRAAAPSAATYRGHVWTDDFVFDRTEQGSALKVLVVLDEYPRECHRIRVAKRLDSAAVVATLGELYGEHGAPAYPRSDNDGEFIATELQAWLAQRGTATVSSAPGHRPWWEGLDLVRSEKLRARQDRTILDHLAPLIQEIDDELAHLSTREPWAAPVASLVQLPGIGVVHAMALLAAIADIGRFAAAKKLVGDSGLGASVHASGQARASGGITKEGRRGRRTTLVEAAWVAVRTHPHRQRVVARLEERLGRGRAMVTIARKLPVVVWHGLSERVADQEADPEQVARKDWWPAQATAARNGLIPGTLDHQTAGHGALPRRRRADLLRRCERDAGLVLTTRPIPFDATRPRDMRYANLPPINVGR